MKRRTFLVTAAGFLAAPLAAEAQQAGGVHRMGFLTSGSATASWRAVDAFRQGLRERGGLRARTSSSTIGLRRVCSTGCPDLAAELVRLQVQVMVAGPTPAAVAARNATREIPIVMWAVGDPVGLGLIASLARPGGNVTGTSFSVGMDTVGKQLELLKETVPKVRRVAVLSNPANPAHALALSIVKIAAQSLGVQLELLEARSPSEFEGAFAAMAKERVAALLVLTDGVFFLHRARLVSLAAKNRLPSMYQLRRVRGGRGPHVLWRRTSRDLSRRAASFVDKILKGAKPADLPVEQPTKFELVINLKTAKALGLTIPPSLLLRADQVIE